jgi:glycosyltransferase involved in cell wall biosynthesis
VKLLHVCCWPPYPENSGGRQRSGAVLRFLRQRHEVQLVTFVSGSRERSLAENAGAVAVDYCYEHYNRALPASVNPFESDELRKTLLSLSDSGFEATIFDHIYVANNVRFSCGVPVLMEHNIESEVVAEVAQFSKQRMKGLAAALFLKKFENEIWPEFPLRFCVSERDAQSMRARCPQGKVVVSENGVDLNRVESLQFIPTPKLFFVGTLDYQPNVDAVHFLLDEILPLVWQQMPGVLLRVAGRSPGRELSDLLDGHPQCELWPSAPDLTDLARTCSLSVVPLRLGGGTRLKILEAAAWGLPVITTRKGCEGLRNELVENLCVVDEPEPFAANICTLLNSPEKREEMADAARKQVEAYYNWPTVLQPMEEAMLELVGA